MLPPRCRTTLALLASAILAGCSSTGQKPFGGGPNSRSVAEIGDRPISAATGEPGARVASEVDGPDLAPRPSPRARISGRVLDDRGRPVPDASVRLADGVAKGGRDLRTQTDRSGAFTLSGLRPNATYTLIAESEADDGPIRGSAEARSSETGVEISLAGREGGPGPRSARPSRARAISNRSEQTGDDEATDNDLDSNLANREDIGPPAEEASPDEAPSSRRSRPDRAHLSPPIAGTGWRKPGSAEKVEASADPMTAPARSHDAAEDAGAEALEFDPFDEGPNPLPPAIERAGDDAEQTSSRPRRRAKVGAHPGTSTMEDAGSLILAADEPGPRHPAPRPASAGMGDEPSDPDPSPTPEALASPDLAPSLQEEAGALANVGGSGLPEMPTLASKNDPSPDLAPMPAAPPDAGPPPGAPSLAADAPTLPASEPVFASEGPSLPDPTPAADYNPFANPFVTQVSNEPPPPPPGLAPSAALPNPGETIAMDVKPDSSPAIPAPKPAEPAPAPPSTPARKMTWGEMAKVGPAPSNVAIVAASTSGSKAKGKARAASARNDEAAALCTYDARLRRLVDFRLPDLEGNPVRLKDLDADYVLLDFWGTWCKPCVDAIPHLVELQKKIGPGRLKVVGIACEQVDPKERKAKVEEVSRRLGINYAVLLSGMDGPCPVQEALHIQAFPTMILLDRNGTVVWRDQGATPATLTRLDRVLAASSARGDSVRR